jgi:hypothetical protein
MHIGGAGAGGVHPPQLPIVTANVAAANAAIMAATMALAPANSTTEAAAPLAATAPAGHVGAPEVSSPVSDSVDTTLEQLSSAPIAQLISGIAGSHPAPDPAIENILLHTVASAIVNANLPVAIATLTELVHRTPERMETLAAEPLLSPMRAQVQSLLIRVTSAAKVEAEVRLATATQAVESAKGHSPRPGDWNPREILPVATHLIESGRYPNILLATNMSQAVINYYGGVELPSPTSLVQRRGRDLQGPAIVIGQAQWAGAVTAIYGEVTELLKRMWRQTPSLMLLVMWVMLGVIAAIAAGIELWSFELSMEVWGAGSAGLLGYGTYRKLRERI